MTNIEAFAHIIDLANRTTDTATYEYLMREAQEIMRDKNTEDIDYCDFRQYYNCWSSVVIFVTLHMSLLNFRDFELTHHAEIR